MSAGASRRQRRDGSTASVDTVLVRWTATMLPPDSPEVQARANRPLSERGPNLALYHQQKLEDEQPPAE